VYDSTERWWTAKKNRATNGIRSVSLFMVSRSFQGPISSWSPRPTKTHGGPRRDAVDRKERWGGGRGTTALPCMHCRRWRAGSGAPTSPHRRPSGWVAVALASSAAATEKGAATSLVTSVTQPSHPAWTRHRRRQCRLRRKEPVMRSGVDGKVAVARV